jgi:nitrate reductase NapD
MHITSCIVHTRPENAVSVQTALEEFEGVEVHGGQEQGKLIVTVELPQGSEAAETMTKFHAVKGVANVAMIYHHNEENEPN